MLSKQVYYQLYDSKMDYSKPSAFSNMNNKPKASPWSNPTMDYKAWKNKDEKKEEKKEVNMASFSEFPDLVKTTEKKTVFEGSSLADKLKEVIAAEEQAAMQRRLKKGETPESILREMCVSLPLKRKKLDSGDESSAEPMTVPDWVTDISKPILYPPFKHKSYEQLKTERMMRRYGLQPSQTMLYDNEDTMSDVSSVEMKYDDIESESEMNEEEISS